ncbi:MAG: asparaginase [Caloramator sp.]|uniref:Asparaginase n=1 Tax=Caloramator proteoclasticus DSM 10124 TaxID=1121262 RepID=A0A1M4S7T5_9CLOT|nr:asparaginase [Caloramator proteoclasticus]GIW48656.1 MAG: asparaginase [Caloramator sp.]SHE28262.1 asparaginase [Caloramator proteoclasticus DSM 10124]
MSEIFVEVTRGPLVECVHRGDAVVVDKTGKVLAYSGDAYKLTYIRSAAKPIQTMNVILSGAADRFNFNDKEIAIMCASHYGEEFHINTLNEMLKKINIKKEALLCGETYSINQAYRHKQLKENHSITTLNSDCSGKHIGVVATCLHKGYGLIDYNTKEHPVQKDTLEVVAKVCDINKDKIIIGVDGCSVPVFGMPIYNMALGYARMVTGYGLNEEYKAAAERVYNSMVAHPEMVAGTNGFCTELIKAAGGKLIGKLGAEAVYCIGIKDLGIGIAVKIEDGNYRALYPAVMKILEDLKILNYNEINRLLNFKNPPNLNNKGVKVGELRAVVEMKKI